MSDLHFGGIKIWVVVSENFKYTIDDDKEKTYMNSMSVNDWIQAVLDERGNDLIPWMR